MDDIEIAVYAIDQASRTLMATAEAIDRLGKRTEDNNQRTKKFGLTLSDMYGGFMLARQGAQMLADGFEAAIGPSVRIQTEFAKIAALTDTPAEAIDGLRESVYKLSKEVPVSAQEMTEALYFISSSGFQGAEAMDILTASSKAAAAGLGETKVVADAVTSTLNAYKMSGEEATRVTDILVEAVRQGKGEPADFAASLGRVLPIAAAAGVEIEQVAASMATMTRAGLSAEESATALRGVIGALEAPGKQAQEALAAVGLSAEQMRQSIRENGLLETLQLLMERTGGNVEILDLIIPNIRALTGVLNSAGSQGEAYAEILGKMKDATGATEKAFSTMSETVESKGKRLENSINAIRDKFASSLLPTLADAADAADTLMNGSDRIAEVFEATAEKIGANATSYEEYRNTLLLTAAAAGYASEANVRAWQQQSDEMLRGTYIYDLMIQKSGLLTEEQWKAAQAQNELNNMAAFSATVQQASADASGQSAQALAAKAEADRAEAQTAFENAQAAEAQAKAQEKARDAAANAAVEYGHLAESLKEATTADLAKMAISNLDESIKAGAINQEQYMAALRAIQTEYDLVTPKSIAMGDAMLKLSEYYNSGNITATQYTDALAKMDKAAQDGDVQMQELGIQLNNTGLKAAGARDKSKELDAGLGALEAQAKKSADQVGTLGDKLNKLPKKINIEVNIIVNGDMPSVPTLAGGGETMAGWPYWVGEQGPEPFIPAVSGRILSRSDAISALSRSGEMGQLASALRELASTQRAGGGHTVNITTGPIASGIDIEALAYRVAKEIQARQ